MIASKPLDFRRELFQDAVNNIQFLKGQQWRITNYILLIYAALFGIDSYEWPEPLNQILVGLASLVAVGGIWLLVSFHRSMLGCRRRMEAIRADFDAATLAAWRVDEKADHAKWWYQIQFTAFFGLVVIGAAVLDAWLICQD